MANYTSNYKLHQWEPGDNFLRTDFNEDFAKIDAAIAEVKTKSHQETAAVQFLCQAVTGTYTGDGKKNREIALGFRPSVVLLQEETGEYATMLVDGGPPVHSSASTVTEPSMELTDQGFQVNWIETVSGGGVRYSPTPYVNRSGKEYSYIAFH